MRRIKWANLLPCENWRDDSGLVILTDEKQQTVIDMLNKATDSLGLDRFSVEQDKKPGTGEIIALSIDGKVTLCYNSSIGIDDWVCLNINPQWNEQRDFGYYPKLRYAIIYLVAHIVKKRLADILPQEDEILPVNLENESIPLGGHDENWLSKEGQSRAIQHETLVAS